MKIKELFDKHWNYSLDKPKEKYSGKSKLDYSRNPKTKVLLEAIRLSSLADTLNAQKLTNEYFSRFVDKIKKGSDK